MLTNISMVRLFMKIKMKIYILVDDVREVHEFQADMHQCQKSSVKYLGAQDTKNSKSTMNMSSVKEVYVLPLPVNFSAQGSTLQCRRWHEPPAR